jgi:hypothetical protein
MVTFFGIDPEITSIKHERNHRVDETGGMFGIPVMRHKITLEWEYSHPAQEDGHTPKDYNLAVAECSTPDAKEIYEAVKKIKLKSSLNAEMESLKPQVVEIEKEVE